jgi:hypothetical protein
MAEHDWLDGSRRGIQPVSKGVDGGTQPIVQHELRPLTTGEILDRTFFLYRSSFWLYVGLASIAAGVNVLTSIVRLGYLDWRGIPETSPNGVLAGSVFSIVGGIVYFAIYSVTHAATVSAVSSIYLGEPTSMSRAFGAVKGHWLRYCLIALWQSWSAGWAFILLILPAVMLPSLGVKGPAVAVGIGFLALLSLGGAAYGVIAYIRNSLAIPAAVMENLSVRRAIRRSKELVAGHKARIFLLLLLLFALYLVAGVLQVPFAMLLLRSRSAEHVIGQFISVFVAFLCSSLIGPVASIALCLFYFDERVRKEAFDIEFLMSKTTPGADATLGGATAEMA